MRLVKSCNKIPVEPLKTEVITRSVTNIVTEMSANHETIVKRPQRKIAFFGG